MQCPACKNQLKEKVVSGVAFDVCENGCGGIWFDRFELNKVDEVHESAGEELLDIPYDETITVDHEQRRNCPKCAGLVLMRHYYSPNRRIEVDECPGCAGLWLDRGELGTIRKTFKTDAERKAFAEKVFGELFDEKLSVMKKTSKEEGEKARQIAHMLRFILPSYYLSGKQDWGAF